MMNMIKSGAIAGLLAAGLLLAPGTAAAAAPAYDPNLVVLSEAFVPSKVFDAKVDFGAVGNNSSDDTAKVQACIDAARNWGNGAIAYFPRGTYKVTSTINVTGGNYHIGGSSPIHTKIQGHGTVNPVMLVTDPVNIRVEFIDIRHTDQMLTAILFRVTRASTQVFQPGPVQRIRKLPDCMRISPRMPLFENILCRGR